MIVKSAARVLDIVEAIGESSEGLGISDLARRLSIPKSSTWNVVVTLLSRRYLERASGGRLILGGRLGDIGLRTHFEGALQPAAYPVMTELVEKTGESVFIGILTLDFDVLLLHKVVSPHVIRYDEELGRRIPAYCTANGRALLTRLSPEELANYLKTKKRQRFTDRTITDRRTLVGIIADVRRNGVAFNIGERIPGASGIGAPIHAGSGRVIAGIAIAGPTGRLLARRLELAHLVKEAAARVSSVLGGGKAVDQVVRKAIRPSRGPDLLPTDRTGKNPEHLDSGVRSQDRTRRRRRQASRGSLAATRASEGRE